jgi:uncharacterized protein
MSEPITYDFEWDATEALANARKHGVPFEQAATVFQDQLALTVFDAEHSGQEDRWFTLGFVTGGSLLAVAHTVATTVQDTRVRLISARPATRRERLFYENEPR